jgi:hypothetical protein
VTGRRGRRRKQLLDDLKETTGYWKLKEAALDGTLWRTRVGRGYEPVVRYYGMNDEDEDVSSYWMILRKQQDTGN